MKKEYQHLMDTAYYALRCALSQDGMLFSERELVTKFLTAVDRQGDFQTELTFWTLRDANLIAAAPDMFEALREIATPGTQGVTGIALRALAKAQGA